MSVATTRRAVGLAACVSVMATAASIVATFVEPRGAALLLVTFPAAFTFTALYFRDSGTARSANNCDPQARGDCAVPGTYAWGSNVRSRLDYHRHGGGSFKATGRTNSAGPP